MKYELKKHQVEGVQFLTDTEFLGALMNWEMGLGKTLCSISFMRQHLAKLRALKVPSPKIICFLPKSMLHQWKAETLKFTPDVYPSVIYLPYSQLKKATELVRYYDIRALILDESHYIKTQGTKRIADFCDLLTAIHESRGAFEHGKIVCLSGTPMMNHAGELYTTWALLSQQNLGASVKLLMDAKRYDMWKQSFAKTKQNSWTTKYGAKKYGNTAEGIENTEMMQELVGPIIHLRKAKDCLDLPETQTIQVDLGLQDDKLLSEAGKDGVLDDEAYMKILSELAKAKTPHAIEWIKNFLATTTEQLIVFCPYKFPLEEIQKKFKKSVIYTGAQNSSERAEAMARFKSGDARIILGTYKAMGIGLNMQFCQKGLYLGYPWTSSDIDQAKARMDRMGQEGKTQHYFLSSGHNDQRIFNLVQSKREAIEEFEQSLVDYQYKDMRELSIEDLI